MRHILTLLKQLHRHLSFTERGLIALVGFILIAIIALWVGLAVTNKNKTIIAAKQVELDKERERSQTQQEEAATEENRLNIARQTAVNKAQTEELGRVSAELATRQVKGKLRVVTQQRTQEQRQYEQKLKDITASTADACQRWLRACAASQRLGLRATGRPCDCVSR